MLSAPDYRPPGPAGLYCPLSGKACQKACPTCPLWKPVQFTITDRASSATAEETRWDCSLGWGVVLQTDTAKRMERLASEMEGLRNSFHAFRQSIVALVGQLGRVPLPPAMGGKLIEAEVRNAG